MEIPVSYILDCLMYAAIGATVVLPLLSLNVKLAPRLGLIDWPKARGLTETQIPIIGHSLVVVSIVTILALMSFFPISPWFLTTAVIMAVMGHFDDRKPLPALDKMFFQIVCVAAVVLLDPMLNRAISEHYGTMGSLWAMFFILGMMNAVNFIDGIDGLAGTVIAVAALGFLLFAGYFPEQYPYAIYGSVLFGMTIPFLTLNVVYRKGFLGNVGSYFFSYVLAVMHLSLPIDAAGPLSRLSLSGLCFLIPVADAMMVLTSRLMTRRSPFKADKGHLHHRLIQTSLPLRYILFTFGLIEVSTAFVGFFIFIDKGTRHSVIPIGFGLSQVAIVSLLILLCEKASKRRMQTYMQRLDSGKPVYYFKYKVSSPDGKQLPNWAMRRLEARICAEIRVTDLVYFEGADTLFVALPTAPEPLRSISGRLEAVFNSENVQSTLMIDSGEFLKVSSPAPGKTRRTA